MGSYKPSDALELVSSFISSFAIEKIGPKVLHLAQQMFWNASTWSWTVGFLEPFDLVDGQIDYITTFPSDFLRIEKAVLVTTGNQATILPLVIEPLLPAMTIKCDSPSRIAVEGTTKLRFNDVPSRIGKVFILYKKKTTIITESNMDSLTLLKFPDDYFYIYLTCVLYWGYLFCEDPRAKDQFGIFQTYIGELKLKEPVKTLETLVPEPRNPA